MVKEIYTARDFEGYEVENRGAVFAPVTYGRHIVRDFMARVTDTLGGRSGGTDKVIRAAIEQAQEELLALARERGGNAVIGFRADVEFSGAEGGMVTVLATGDAAYIRKR